jgi:tetratricopeptide (TPR) repeat protein
MAVMVLHRASSQALTAFVCTSIVAFAGAAPESTVITTLEDLRRIEAAQTRGVVDPLRVQYRAQVERRPSDEMPQIYVAWCGLPSDESWNQLKSVAAQHPENPWAHFGMGRIYTLWKMADQARHELNLVLKDHPRFFPAMTGLGDLARAGGDLARAEEHYRSALAIFDDPVARGGLGLIFFTQGKNDAALKELTTAVATFPEQAAVLSALLKLQIDAKAPDAIKTAEVLTEIRPKEREVRRTLGDLRYERSDTLGALAEYERLVKMGNPELEVLTRMVEIYRTNANAVGEAKTLALIVKIDSSGAAPCVRLAELHLEGRRLPEARQSLEEALVRDSKNERAHWLLAEMHSGAKLMHLAWLHYRAAAAIGNAEAASKVLELEESFALPKKNLKGSVNVIFNSSAASLNSFYLKRKAARPNLGGFYRIRVKVLPTGVADSVEVVEDSLSDPQLLGHVYALLQRAEYEKKAGSPVFEFELGQGKKK